FARRTVPSSLANKCWCRGQRGGSRRLPHHTQPVHAADNRNARRSACSDQKRLNQMTIWDFDVDATSAAAMGLIVTSSGGNGPLPSARPNYLTRWKIAWTDRSCENLPLHIGRTIFRAVRKVGSRKW